MLKQGLIETLTPYLRITEDEQECDIALVDIENSTNNGYDFVEQLRKMHPAAIIIVISNEYALGVGEKVKFSGGDAVLIHPFSQHELLMALGI